MRNTLTNVVAFAAGAAIGSAVAWKLAKTKYEKIAQEEIDSVKETFSNRQSEPVDGDTEESESKRYLKEVAEPFAEGLAEGLAAGSPQTTQLDIRGYAEQLQDMEYTDYSSKSNQTTKKKSPKSKKKTRYVIRPEDFGEMDDYEQVSLTYYEDGVLAYENGEIVEDVDNVVGLDPSEHFGEYEDDSVFVRNDDLKRDYEILYDPRKYRDVVHNSPHQAEEQWEEKTMS